MALLGCVSEWHLRVPQDIGCSELHLVCLIANVPPSNRSLGVVPDLRIDSFFKKESLGRVTNAFKDETVQPRFHDFMAVVYLTVASTERVNYISSSSGQPLGLRNNFMSLPELLFWTGCWSISTCDGQTCTPRFA
jgi:hypothetical protein